MVTEYRYYDYMVNMYGSNKVLSERLCAVYGNYTWEEKTSSVRTWGGADQGRRGGMICAERTRLLVV